MAQLVSNEDGTQSGPSAELWDSSCMISSFNSISGKNICWLMSVICSWAKKKTGPVIICFGSGVVKTPVN